MAHDGATALKFVESMHARIRGAFARECAELEAFKAQKTGEPVYVPLPEAAVDALKEVGDGSQYFFWTGNGLRKSAVADWQRSLRRVFREANVAGNAHMFRHTFATDLLTRGVPIEDVSILLGHATPVITAK